MRPFPPSTAERKCRDSNESCRARTVGDRVLAPARTAVTRERCGQAAASTGSPAHRRARHVPGGDQKLFVSSRGRSEEHTSELQSLRHLVCRLLLEKKKQVR